jgi:DegV family protein with EDD domain
MVEIKLMVDSSCDIPFKEIKKKGIYLVPIHINFGEDHYLDLVELEPHSFMGMLITSKTHPSTQPPTAEEIYDEFVKARDEGTEILYAPFVSSKISKVYENALSAKQAFDKVYGDMEIYVKDTKFTSIAYGSIVHSFIDMIEYGTTVKYLDFQLKNLIKSTRVSMVLNTLEYLKRGGRVGSAVAFFGKVLNIKPLISIEDGEVIGYGRARGMKNALKETVKYQEQFFDEEEQLRAVYGYTTSVNLANELKELIEEKFNVKKTHFTAIGPTIGTHIGPKAAVVSLQTLLK